MTYEGRDIEIIINGKSRSGIAGAEKIQNALIAEGFNIRKFDVTTQLDDFNQRLKNCIDRGAPLIGIGGGDGTREYRGKCHCWNQLHNGCDPHGYGKRLGKRHWDSD